MSNPDEDQEAFQPVRTHPAKKLLLQKRLHRMAALTDTHKQAQIEAAERELAASMSSAGWESLIPETNGYSTEGVAQWILDARLATRDMSQPIGFDSGSVIGILKSLGMPHKYEAIVSWFRALEWPQLNHLGSLAGLSDFLEFSYFASIYLEIMEGLHPDWPCMSYEVACTSTNGEPWKLRHYAWDIFQEVSTRPLH
jgi:hypothetical protein